MTLAPEVIDGLQTLEQLIVDRAKSLQRQRDFMGQIRRAASMDPPSYSGLHRLLELPAREEILREFGADAASLRELHKTTDTAWGPLRVSAVNDFYELARQQGIPIRGQAPHFTAGRGMDVIFDVEHNRTTVNGTLIHTVDPRDVLDQLRHEHEHVWGGDFEPVEELTRIYSAYTSIVSRIDGITDGVPVLAVYEWIRASLQGAERKRFTRSVFAASLSRILEASPPPLDGKIMLLRPTATRSDALRIFLPDADDWAYRGRILFKGAV